MKLENWSTEYINLAIIEDDKAIGSVDVSIGEEIYEKGAVLLFQKANKTSMNAAKIGFYL